MVYLLSIILIKGLEKYYDHRDTKNLTRKYGNLNNIVKERNRNDKTIFQEQRDSITLAFIDSGLNDELLKLIVIMYMGDTNFGEIKSILNNLI